MRCNRILGLGRRRTRSQFSWVWPYQVRAVENNSIKSPRETSSIKRLPWLLSMHFLDPIILPDFGFTDLIRPSAPIAQKVEEESGLQSPAVRSFTHCIMIIHAETFKMLSRNLWNTWSIRLFYISLGIVLNHKYTANLSGINKIQYKSEINSTRWIHAAWINLRTPHKFCPRWQKCIL